MGSGLTRASEAQALSSYAMRVAALTASLLLSALAFGYGCSDGGIEGSGNLVGEVYDLAGFTSVSIASGFDATIRWSETHSVEVEVDDNVLEFVEVSTEGDTLIVRLDEDKSYRSGVTRTATITLPDLAEVTLSGAAHAELVGFPPRDDFAAELSGASALEGEIDVTSLRLVLSGASSTRLRGSATEADLDASGASTLGLEELVLEIARAALSGGSYGELMVLDELGPVDASGASHLRYHGTPNVTGVETSGESTVRPIE